MDIEELQGKVAALTVQLRVAEARCSELEEQLLSCSRGSVHIVGHTVGCTLVGAVCRLWAGQYELTCQLQQSCS